MKVNNHGQKGFTFVELIFAVIITVLATLVLISHLAISYKQSRSQRDRVFAFMVAKSILSEVQAFAAAGEGSENNDVDDLDDGSNVNPTLSIATTGAGALLPPDHELSGNSMRGMDWVWSRQITVRPLAGLDNRMLRYVSVRIFKQNEKGVRREIANLSSVVNSLALSYPSTQVFDVYFLAIENIPGWWVHMEAIRPFMEAMVTDLERNNPGLRIRTHWITKASYGRNPVYRPYINVETDSHSKAEGVYYYPGLMPAGNASSYYYVPSVIKGRV
ncbi:MAG: type IV pilus modification PilV family protein, partial [Planctomycetota bacterium]